MLWHTDGADKKEGGTDGADKKEGHVVVPAGEVVGAEDKKEADLVRNGLNRSWDLWLTD